MNVTTLGIDLAKNVFQVHGANDRGKEVFSKQLSRAKLHAFVANHPRCLIGMEACGGAHHWAREFIKMGHEVKLMGPQRVKPYIPNNKNDKNDAKGIAEAVTRPEMSFVPIKSVEQHDLRLLHIVRSRLVSNRTQLSNEIRGVLTEYGIVVPVGSSALHKKLTELLYEDLQGLSIETKAVLEDLYCELQEISKRVEAYTLKLKQFAKKNPSCQKLMQIPGVKEMTATSFLSHIDDVHLFKRGRNLSAYLGLTPKEHSSGGKHRMGGLSKRGNVYLRCLLIQGAKSVIRNLETGEKDNPYYKWIRNLLARGVHRNKAAVALANKHVRMIWALLKHDREFSYALGR